MTRSAACKARQHSDQMLCECGLGWDMNDPDPPQCRKTAVATQELSTIRQVLTEPARWALKKNGLLVLQESPLRHLPTFGIPSALYQVNWPSMPDVVFVLVGEPVDIEDDGAHARDYQFFDRRGQKHLEVKRCDGGDGPPFQYRYNKGRWATE